MATSKLLSAPKSALWLRLAVLTFCAMGTAMAAVNPRFDREALLRYVTFIEQWPSDAQVTVDEPHDSSAFPGLRELTVRRSRLGRVVAERRYFLSNDGQRFFKAEVFEIGRAPYSATIERLKKASAPSTGPADAPVTLVVFADFQCPDCAAEVPVLRQYIPQEFAKTVRIQFRDYPLVQHKWAMDAAIAGRCAFHVSNDLFLRFHDWVFSVQKELTPEVLAARIEAWAAEAKAGPAFQSCVATRATENEVKESLADGLALAAPGTPTLFLNGRPVPMDTDWTTLKAMIQYELKATPPADACCLAGPQ